MTVSDNLFTKQYLILRENIAGRLQQQNILWEKSSPTAYAMQNIDKVIHRKQYGSDMEEKFRMKIYMDNVRKIELHNQKYANKLVKYKLAVNKFADLLHHEFVHIVNGFNRTNRLNDVPNKFESESITFIPPANVELPKNVDWREKGAVTPVKDQGHCGSCWSFSATGALEGQHFRKSGKMVSLSEQNLVDCSGKFGNNGCNGGLMDNAFKYIKYNHGIDTEKSYPYEALDDKCRFNPKNVGATDRGFVDIESGNEENLKAAVATVGPISVAIDAGHESFQFYAEGVYEEPQCSPYNLDHGVLAVGYGTSPEGDDYWIVKNSWDTFEKAKCKLKQAEVTSVIHSESKQKQGTHCRHKIPRKLYDSSSKEDDNENHVRKILRPPAIEINTIETQELAEPNKEILSLVRVIRTEGNLTPNDLLITLPMTTEEDAVQLENYVATNNNKAAVVWKLNLNK
ncbi:hypothetical protein FQA39_LY04843 [Lamprigera yunnana]|nr:hypothetical protein FQA39_LY04843 [Lamprigera yunnana]